MLDSMLAEITRANRTYDALHWVRHATRHADEIRNTSLERLIDKRILELSDDRYLWIFGTRHYLLKDEATERKLTGRIKSTLLADSIPDPKDVMIVTLADGCGIVSQILSDHELDAAKARIDLLRRVELIGRVFLEAIEMAVQPAASNLEEE